VPEPVLTKADFVRRYEAGEFGNHSPTWDDWQSWLEDDGQRYGSLFHIRNRVAGGDTWYDVPYYLLGSEWGHACCCCKPEQLYISCMAPTELTLLQGEVQRGVWGLDLYYSTVRKPMRQALATSSHSVSGIMANCLLRGVMDPYSYEWLEYLLGAYPNHVIEFSVYDCDWGTVPLRNTVIWEVRAY